MGNVLVDDIRVILREGDGWFKPDMPSKQLILDNRLTNYPYIVVRVITGIHDSGIISVGKIFAVNMDSKRGWIKAKPLHYVGNWRSYLINTCRDCWNQSVTRAVKMNLSRMTIEEYDKVCNA